MLQIYFNTYTLIVSHFRLSLLLASYAQTTPYSVFIFHQNAERLSIIPHASPPPARSSIGALASRTPARKPSLQSFLTPNLLFIRVKFLKLFLSLANSHPRGFFLDINMRIGLAHQLGLINRAYPNDGHVQPICILVYPPSDREAVGATVEVRDVPRGCGDAALDWPGWAKQGDVRVLDPSVENVGRAGLALAPMAVASVDDDEGTGEGVAHLPTDAAAFERVGGLGGGCEWLGAHDNGMFEISKSGMKMLCLSLLVHHQ